MLTWWPTSGESFQLHIGFSFTFLRANDLSLSILNIRACSFLLPCSLGGTYTRLLYSWYQFFFTWLQYWQYFMQRTKKTEEKNIKTRQHIKKGRSKHCCRRQSTWLVIAPLSHCYCYAFAPLLLHCRTAIVPLLLRRCRSVVAPMLHGYCTGISPLSLRCCRSCCRYAVAPLLRHCCSAAVDPAVATQSHRYHTAFAPLSLCWCCSCCRYAVAPAIASAVDPFSRRCRTAIAPLSLLSICCRCCCSCCRNGITAAIAPAVTPGRLLKRHNQGNSFHQWLSGACVFLLRGVFDFAENSQGGSLLT